MDAASDPHTTQAAAARVRLMTNGHAPEPVLASPAFETVPVAAVAATAARTTRRPRTIQRTDAAPAPAVLADASVAARAAVVDPEPVVAVPELEPEIVPAAAVAASKAPAARRPRTNRRNAAATEAAALADASVAAHAAVVDPEPVVAVPELEPEIVPAAAVAASKAPAARRPRTTRRNAAATEAAALADSAAAAPPAAVDPEPIIVAAPAPLPVAPIAAGPVTAVPAPDATRHVASSAPPVCPFLGFKDDQTTRCDYPDTRNMCHAAAANAGMSRRGPRRLGRGGGRSVAISPDHQSSLCLTTNHQQCERYPKAPAAKGLA